MVTNIKNSNIVIKEAKQEDFYDLNLCAEEFIELIDDFEINFLNKKYFVLTIYYNNVLAGILVAEETIERVHSFDEIIPKLALFLLYINPTFRNKHLGKKLLNTYLNIQKKNGIASIYVDLPQKYKKGINFFLKNNFHQIKKSRNKILLEINLWYDFGIRDYEIIESNLNSMFY